MYLRFHYYHKVDISTGGLLILMGRGIIRAVISDSVLTWFIRYSYYWYLRFVNSVYNVNLN